MALKNTQNQREIIKVSLELCTAQTKETQQPNKQSQSYVIALWAHIELLYNTGRVQMKLFFAY